VVFSDDVEEADENFINKDESDYENLQEQIAELTRQLNDMKSDQTPPKMTPVKKASKMTLEEVSNKSLFDEIPAKTTARKAKVFKNILDDLE